MASNVELIASFLGGDPIAGFQALNDLVAEGDVREEALFSRPIQFPKNVQSRRRWLRYVATRKSTVGPRLLDRIRNPLRFRDAHAAALLFAGLGKETADTNALYTQIKTDLANYNSDAGPAFEAWGFAGGDGGTLWHLVKESSFAWEKLITFVFRAACASLARFNANDDWSVEQLIKHKWGDFEVEMIGDSPESKIPHAAVDSSELWLQANDPFMVWRRGEVADTILREWSHHAHWRVRDFGAQVLASLGFQRTLTAIVDWLQRESLPSVRSNLLHALERSETTEGADVLLDHFSTNGEGAAYVAKAAWRANDKNRAERALITIADTKGVAATEALVSLARLGNRHPQLSDALNSGDHYRRLNAALAVAHLGDQAAVGRLVAMQSEASTPLERVCLAASLAILKKPDGPLQLQKELIATAGHDDYERRIDVFFLHRYLQNAILEGLAAGGSQTADALNAWRNELEPLEPSPAPVIASRAKTEGAKAAKLSDALHGPLNVFISYSHLDEKMRKKLGAHLSQLENDGLIRIWHDREIEAGDDWEGEINREISSADLILLLVSASFLNSGYCRKELQRAIQLRGSDRSIPIPIILRDCDWTGVFNRSEYKIQALPRDNRAVAGGGWPNQDAAFASIARELRKKVEGMRGSHA